MEYLFHPVSPCVLMNSQSFVQKLSDCLELLAPYEITGLPWNCKLCPELLLLILKWPIYKFTHCPIKYVFLLKTVNGSEK